MIAFLIILGTALMVISILHVFAPIKYAMYGSVSIG